MTPTDRIIGATETNTIDGDRFLARIYTTSDSTLRAWSWLIGDHPIVRIEFPKAETHWHYKLRMLKTWLKGLPSRMRWKLFPYYIIHKDAYEELTSDY